MRRLITTLLASARPARFVLPLLLAAACGAPQRPRAGVENPVVRLQRDIAKVDRAIEATKRLLALAHSAPYVPDLYMRLAELYAEQSRYQYLIAYENDPKKGRAIVSIPARLLKEQAVQLYDRVAREFTDYQDLDKAIFFKGHELRELGNYDEMIATFERLVRDFPRSRFRHQALIIIGDYNFDRSSFGRAEEQYKKVLADAEGPQHAMARYKLAWSRQNQDDCKGALGYFEAAARTAVPAEAGAAGVEKGGEKGRKVDLRREALVDSGYCYTEVRRAEEAIPFYRGLSESRTVYVASLVRLARRYHSKGQFKAAAPLYREILEVDPHHEDALEFVARFYEGLNKSPSPATVERDVEIIARVAELRYFSPNTPEATRKAMVHDFEAYARDLATKAQLQAKDGGEPRLIEQVASAYERYLSFFRDVARAPEAQAVEGNLADTLYSAKRLIPAGRAYEAVAQGKGTPPAERKTALFSAAAAYAQALKGRLSNYEQVAARAGLYRAGRAYIASYPQADNLPELKFNIANTLYDEGNFREAIARFTALAEQYPKTKEGQVAAQLTLDSYRLLYDMEGLVRAGRRLLGNATLVADEGLRKKLGDVVAAAEQRQLDVLTVSAGASEHGTDTLRKFAQRNAGSALGEKALLNAFLSARDQQDVARMIQIGDDLLRDYPKSSEAITVLGTLGKLTAQAAQFEEAARYLDEAARRETGARGQEMQRTAAVLRAQRGDRKGAEEGLHALVQSGAPPALLTDVQQALGELYRHTGDAAALIELGRAPAAPADLHMDAARAALAGGATVDKVAADLRAAAAAGGDVAGEARLLLLDLSQRQLEGISFTDKRGDDAKVIQRRFAMANQLEAQYLQLIKQARPPVIIQALGRLIALYQGGAQFLAGAPAPDGLNAEQAEKYKAAFASKAQPLAKKAEDAQRTCAETAQQLRVFTASARACMSGQAPPRFEPLPAGVAARPTQPEAPALRARLLKNPSDAEALVQLGLLHLKAGDLFGAKLAADRAVEIGGGGQSAAHNLAGVLAYQFGDIGEAHRHFQEALKIDRRNPRARLNLSTLYREYGYSKLIATEFGGLGDIPADLARDPAVLPAAESAPQEKK